MEYMCLGASGLKVSRICLGMMSYGDPSWREWVLEADAAEAIIRHAVELGVIFFDTADVYSMGVSEELTGRSLRELFARREDYVIATKVCSPMGSGPNDRGLSRKHILSSIDDSLRRLGTDYVDLYQVHRWDGGTPVEETMEALNDIVRAGKVRYIGASSMYAWQFATAQHVAERRGWTRFVSMQNHYNLVYREEEREMIPFCRHTGVGIVPWSPLARGLLAGGRGTGRHAQTVRARSDDFARRLYDASDLPVVDAAGKVAEERDVPTAQVALAWLLSRPGVVSPIVGATKVAHLDDAVAALDISLSSQEVERLEAPYRPHDIRGHG